MHQQVEAEFKATDSLELKCWINIELNIELK